MSDKSFSVETQLANKLRSYLIQNNLKIVQLVSPGGQCHFSLTYLLKNSQEKRTCFPDLICFSDTEIWIGEIKPSFSLEDKQKLMQIKDSQDAESGLKSYLKRKYKVSFNNHNVIYNLIHADPQNRSDDFCVQLIFTEDSLNILRPDI